MSTITTEAAKGIIYQTEKNRLRLKVVITRVYEKPTYQIPTQRRETMEESGLASLGTGITAA